MIQYLNEEGPWGTWNIVQISVRVYNSEQSGKGGTRELVQIYRLASACAVR